MAAAGWPFASSAASVRAVPGLSRCIDRKCAKVVWSELSENVGNVGKAGRPVQAGGPSAQRVIGNAPRCLPSSERMLHDHHFRRLQAASELVGNCRKRCQAAREAIHTAQSEAGRFAAGSSFAPPGMLRAKAGEPALHPRAGVSMAGRDLCEGVAARDRGGDKFLSGGVVAQLPVGIPTCTASQAGQPGPATRCR